ncbi:UNVERIFIED_CONTAM: hypothetical protein RMT77_006380 [Armadillidium vulgare]
MRMNLLSTMKIFKIFIFLIFCVAITQIYAYENKYSEDSNMEVLHLRDPLRMAKLNVIWEKARKRLSEPKLRKLLSELKVQDKEELTFKKLKASGGDKEGLKEAELRKRLKHILKKFALEYHDDVEDEKHLEKKLEKAIFKDKKLHKLWLKAEQSGLTQEELKTLKEEFQHHQDKIDEYHVLIEQVSSPSNGIPAIMNDVHNLDFLESAEGSVKEYNDNINTIRNKHQEIKNGYNHLHRKASSGPESKEFFDPKVAGLWKMALRADFNDVELESLFTELKHYEQRLYKLSYLTLELNKISLGKFDSESLTEEDKDKILNASETEGRRILEERLKKQKRKAEKLHEDLELRILARHSEL